MSKYKYYFKQPRTEIVKDIFSWIGAVGTIYIAASSPYFVINVLKSFKRGSCYKRKEICNTFYRLKKNGSIIVEKKNHQIYISLTENGRKKAGMFQINHLRIKKQKKWDKKWRIIIFDIQQTHKTKREALRGFLKRLGFYQLQKSVWVCPYNCRDEVGLLKDFFGLTDNELRFMTACDIGNASELRKFFKL